MAVGIIARDAVNTARTLTGIVARDASNTSRTITEMWVRDPNNTLRLVFNPSGSALITVSASPDTVTGFGSGTGIVTTDSTTATAINGTAPYTYAWTLISYGGATPPTANSAASATTTFTQTGLSPFDVTSSTWRVTATDALSNTATFDVTANFAESS